MCEESSQGKAVAVSSYDQSASFDMCEPQLVIDKLKYFQVSEMSRKWMLSFLSNRTQKVRVGSAFSDIIEIPFGAPQGAILSPLIFLIYVSDVDLWVDKDCHTSYCDDSNIAVSGDSKSQAITKLEHVSHELLIYFSSNYLVANASKTTFMVIRNGRDLSSEKFELHVTGSIIQESPTMEMLGIVLSNDLKWTSHINKLLGNMRNVNGLLSRLAAHVPKSDLLPVVHGLLISRIRYGLAVFGRVKLNENEPENGEMNSIQVEMNRALRLVCGKKLSDQISVQTLLTETKTKSVNQMSAEVKLQEMWRTVTYDLPLNDYLPKRDDKIGKITRTLGRGLLEQSVRNGFQSNLCRVWNTMPCESRCERKSKNQAFKIINNHISTYPYNRTNQT